jgi:hypothetical protein
LSDNTEKPKNETFIMELKIEKSQTQETPNIVYGRLLESAHISGYSFERVCAELEWLLEEDRW